MFEICGGSRVQGDERRCAGENITPPALLSPANQEFSTALAQLWARIRALPRAQQEVLILIAIEGRSYAEAAQITGAPVGTVRLRLARARNAVQQGFQDKEEYSVD